MSEEPAKPRSEPTPAGPDVDRLLVPDDLRAKLHQANERFRLAKENLEQAMDESDMDHEEHVKRKFEELRKSEKELEELARQVEEIVGRKP